MSMSKKDYVAIARAIRSQYDDDGERAPHVSASDAIYNTAFAISLYCAADNPRFDRARKYMSFIVRCLESHDDLLAALQVLHDETADYVRINNLGDPYANKSMRDARYVLARATEGSEKS